MDSCTNNSIRAHAITESFKTEALSSCIMTFEKSGRELPLDAESFIMDTVELWLDKFDILKTYDLNCYSLHVSDDEDPTLFVKAEDVNELFVDFKKRLTQLLLQLVMYDLELYLARKEIE